MKLHLINPLQSFPSIVKAMYFIYKLQNHNLKGGHFYIITMHLILLQHLGKYRKQISENCILFYHVVILILPNVWTAKLGNLRTLFHVVSFELLGGYKYQIYSMRVNVVILFLYQGCQRVHVEYSTIARSRQSSTKISWPTMFYKVKKKIGYEWRKQI